MFYISENNWMNNDFYCKSYNSFGDTETTIVRLCQYSFVLLNLVYLNSCFDDDNDDPNGAPRITVITTLLKSSRTIKLCQMISNPR